MLGDLRDLPRNTLSYIYTPLFRSQSLNKDRILSSEGNRFRCDSEPEKRKDQRKEDGKKIKMERIASSRKSVRLGTQRNK